MFELIKKVRLDFIGKRKYAFITSGVFSILGIVATICIFFGWANLGIDFSGGTLIQLSFKSPPSIEQLRSILVKNKLGEAEIQEMRGEGGKKAVVLRIRKAHIATGNVAQKIKQIFSKAFPNNPIIIEKSEEVGPKIGYELRKKALWAVFWAIIAIIIYIAFRFEFRFGVAAAVATLHDVLVVIGILWICNREITLLIVTALLTIAGYSLTDTVVVFDRIRENIKVRRKDLLETIVNDSINQVLSRTVVTSLTTILAVFALLIIGSIVTFNFALALTIGIIIGTYSSVFIASPILVEWHHAALKYGKQDKRSKF